MYIAVLALNVGRAVSAALSGLRNSIEASFTSFRLSLDYGRGDHFGRKIHSAKEEGGAGEDRGGAGQDDGI